MKTNLGRESAKIYQFPLKGALLAGQGRAKIKAATDLASLPIVEVSYGSGWYHDAAIREDSRTHKF